MWRGHIGAEWGDTTKQDGLGSVRDPVDESLPLAEAAREPRIPGRQTVLQSAMWRAQFAVQRFSV